LESLGKRALGHLQRIAAFSGRLYQGTSFYMQDLFNILHVEAAALDPVGISALCRHWSTDMAPLQALDRPEPSAFPLNAALLPSCRQRVKLAVRLDAILREQSKANAGAYSFSTLISFLFVRTIKDGLLCLLSLHFMTDAA